MQITSKQNQQEHRSRAKEHGTHHIQLGKLEKAKDTVRKVCTLQQVKRYESLWESEQQALHYLQCATITTCSRIDV